MLSFKNFIQLDEGLLRTIKSKLYGNPTETHLFDLDDTLVKHDPTRGAKVYVKDETGKRIKTLSPAEFNAHKFASGHSPDFEDFAKSEVFADSAHPIRKMINHAQRLLDNGHYVHILTARADMNNPALLLGTLKQMGLDTSHPRFHLHRAGNLGKNPTHINKANMIHNILTSAKFGLSGIKKIFMYDDHKANVTDIFTAPISDNKSLRELHPDKEFHGILFKADKIKRVA